jgi:hypothetical protein
MSEGDDGAPPEAPASQPTENRLSQGSEELRDFLTSPQAVAGLVLLMILSVLMGVLITTYGNDKLASAYLGAVILSGFALRHFIGTRERQQFE